MALVTLRSYRDAIDAELARAVLESEGIHAVVLDAQLVSVAWLYSAAIGGVKVQVDEADLDRARDVLSRDHSAELDAIPKARASGTDRHRCPRCESPFVRPSRLYRGAAALSLLISIPIPVGRDRMVCRACGYAWTQRPHAGAEVPRETIEAERAVYEHRSHPEIAVIGVVAVLLGALWLVQRAC